MLQSLSIKNYALIKELEFVPDKGLNIVTGETGAGKSIMLGALGLLTGNRADVKTLLNPDVKCIIEGTFNIQNLKIEAFFVENDLDFEKHTIIRREIAPSGKSRAFVNDQPVTLDVLKELGNLLMDIHSQHDTLQLGSNDFQLSILDLYSQNETLLADFREKYKIFKKVEEKYKNLLLQADQLKKEFDFNTFLLAELSEIPLENLNQEDLENEQQVLENAEDIKRYLALSFDILQHPEIPAIGLLRESLQNLNHISKHSEKYNKLKDRFATTLIELEDISNEIEKENHLIDSDDKRLIQVTETLNNIYRLQKKHGVSTIKELIEIKAQKQSNVDTVLNLSSEIEKYNKDKDLALEQVTLKAQEISATRNTHAITLANLVNEQLQDLGMPNALLKIEITRKELGNDGLDNIAFKFTANKGTDPRLLKEVASGGEFSRLMLALKYILAKKANLPTIIFDEIDTGISGQIAVKVGLLLQEMGETMQVITITHLPQIAAKGRNHYYVYKDEYENRTISNMRKLTNNERIQEIAIMIGGENPSVSAINSAKELFNN